MTSLVGSPYEDIAFIPLHDEEIAYRKTIELIPAFKDTEYETIVIDSATTLSREKIRPYEPCPYHQFLLWEDGIL